METASQKTEGREMKYEMTEHSQPCNSPERSKEESYQCAE